MEARVTFKINYYQDNKKKSGICLEKILCGNVESDGLPIPVYAAILKAMLQVEDLLNGEDQLTEPHVLHSNLPITSPGESLKEMGALREDVIEDTIKKEIGEPVKKKRLIKSGPTPPPDLPPTPKTVVTYDNKHKPYTVEEKTEIAMMYASGMPVATIAEKFGRNANAINILVSKMGVKRGDNIEDTDTPADESDRPKVKKGSALVKPWYLKPQVNIKDKK